MRKVLGVERRDSVFRRAAFAPIPPSGFFGATARQVLVLFQSPRLLGRAAQEELDLRVQAAQIVVRPALDGVQHGGVDTKEKRLALGQGLRFW